MRASRQFAALVLACTIGARSIQAQTSGTYQMDGSSYSLTVEVGADELIVIEPNKRSVYRRVGTTNEYRFFNVTTGSTFALTVIDARTLRASRVPQTIAPNTLRLVGAETAAAASDEHARFRAMADRYRLLAEGDTDNTQMWTFCAAAAHGWAMKTEADAALYAWKAAQSLKSIMVDPARSPCRDAIPQLLWESAAAPVAGSALGRAPQADHVVASGASTGAGVAQLAPRGESAAAAVLRERAATTAAASAAAAGVADTHLQEADARAKQEAQARLESEAATAVAKVVGDRMSGAARMAPAMPSMQEWAAAFKDFNARRKAIAAQDAYVAQVRADRLASGAPDVQGFATPRRPSPSEVVDQATGARVTGMGLWPDYDPNLRQHFIEQLDAMSKAKLATVDFGLSQDPRPRMDPPEWRPGFSASLVPARARVQLVIESTEGKLVKYALYTCTVFGPDGGKLAEASPLANNNVRRHAIELVLISRAWKPGTYGVECGPAYGATPWVNMTFDVVP